MHGECDQYTSRERRTANAASLHTRIDHKTATRDISNAVKFQPSDTCPWSICAQEDEHRTKNLVARSSWGDFARLRHGQLATDVLSPCVTIDISTPKVRDVRVLL